jgi:hypothetical protein
MINFADIDTLLDRSSRYLRDAELYGSPYKVRDAVELTNEAIREILTYLEEQKPRRFHPITGQPLDPDTLQQL